MAHIQSTIEIRCGECMGGGGVKNRIRNEMENVLSGAAAAMNVALKMKNLFNNACTFHHKSYVIFSFSPLFSFRLPSFILMQKCVVLYLVDRWCECSRTLATGWSVHTNTNFAYPSIVIYCRHSHSASLHVAQTHTHTLIVVTVIAHFLVEQSADWVFDSVDYTANCTYERTSVLRAYNRHLYIWEKFSIYRRRTDKSYSDENGREKVKPEPIEKRNKITKNAANMEWKLLKGNAVVWDEQTSECAAVAHGYGMKRIEHWSGQHIQHIDTKHHYYFTLLLLHTHTLHTAQLCFYFILS